MKCTKSNCDGDFFFITTTLLECNKCGFVIHSSEIIELNPKETNPFLNLDNLSNHARRNRT